jgi:hypothetical protein
MFVTCKIKNLNHSDYQIVTFRKFYQVIFWETDLRTLKIYTNTVIGCEDPIGIRKVIYPNFDIEISFRCTDEKDCKLSKFKITNVDKSGFLISDINALQAVWGNETKIVLCNDEFSAYYRQLFNKESNLTDNPNNNYLFIKDSNINDTESNTIAKITKNTNEESNKKFRINSKEMLHENVEIVNLTLTTIVFNEKQTTLLNYLIEFDSSQKFTTKDNSFYFVLPDNFDTRGTGASIYLKGKNEPTEIQNTFQSLDPNSKNYVQEWIDNGIEERKYYRVNNTEHFKEFSEARNYHKLHFNFRIYDTVNPIIKQLINGLFISLFFAYNLDQTRLIYFRKLYWQYDIIPPDINFLITFLPLFFSILYKFSLGSVKENLLSLSFRNFTIILSIIWFFTLYCCNGSSFYSTPDLNLQNIFTDSGIRYAHCLNRLVFLFSMLSLLLILIFHYKQINFSFFRKLKRSFVIRRT